ncbi:MAG: flagellar filament outer layer protein FlaA [Treponema sp.]|nr:flagellar filament outer layer protein FlaA [Treponema sp.]
MLCLAGFSAFADESTQNLMALVVDDFSGATTKEWRVGGRTWIHEFDWAVEASRFATNVDDDPFPKLTFVEAWPMQLFGTNREGLDIRSLGIWGRFDRRGYNWIDVYPVVPGTASESEPPEAFEIPVPGRLREIDMWVWGANHNFYLEAYFRDYQGVVHSLHMGSLAYAGWRNLRIAIPNHIRQSRATLPRYAGLTFVKFRIWTTPTARVDNFYVYFNQMKILTDTFETMFDGNDLADPDHVLHIWAQN